MANNERRRGDQDFNHRPTGIVIPLEELKPLTSGDEPINELIVATSARNANDITGVEDSLNNNRNINYTAKKNFSQGETLNLKIQIRIKTFRMTRYDGYCPIDGQCQSTALRNAVSLLGFLPQVEHYANLHQHCSSGTCYLPCSIV